MASRRQLIGTCSTASKSSGTMEMWRQPCNHTQLCTPSKCWLALLSPPLEQLFLVFCSVAVICHHHRDLHISLSQFELSEHSVQPYRCVVTWSQDWSVQMFPVMATRCFIEPYSTLQSAPWHLLCARFCTCWCSQLGKYTYVCVVCFIPQQRQSSE